MGLWYKREGKGGKSPLVFLHGVGSNHTIWMPYLSAFPGRRVFLIDLPGHGFSQHTFFDSVQDAAWQVIAILKKEAVHDACMVGQSLGGLVGLEAAALSPERVARVALSSPLSKGLVRAHPLFEVAASWLRMASAQGMRERQVQDYSRPAKSWLVTYPYMDFKGTSCATIGKAVGEALGYTLPWERISQPVLILQGIKDPFLKRDALREHIKGRPGVRIEEISMHHLLITHAQDQVIAALRGFLK